MDDTVVRLKSLFPRTSQSKRVLTAALFIFSMLSACNGSIHSELEPESDMSQSPETSLQDEQQVYLLTAAAGRVSANPEFLKYRGDEELTNLHLLGLDGKIKAPTLFDVDYHTVPNFKKIRHIPDRKQAFFNYLKPAVDYQNHLMVERRLILRGIQQQLADNQGLLPAQESYLAAMRTRYRAPEDLNREQALALLLGRVDGIPDSLVLAQAAIESGWGTSRFAREANNLFGQWCFTPGCGLVPTSRNKNGTHEVAKFTTVDEGVGSYFLHINSHPLYAKTREVRERDRAEDKPLSGYAMAVGLKDYSARGNEYVKELRSMIRSNKLE